MLSRNKKIILFFLFCFGFFPYPGNSQNPKQEGMPIYGFHLLDWSQEGLASETTKEQLTKIAGLGSGWVVLTPFWYMESKTSSVIKRGSRTATDAALLAAAREAKALGLKIALKPHIDVETGGSRAYIDPAHEEAWFTRYWAIIRHNARLAELMQADMLVVGTELFSMTRPRHTYLWQAMIADMRQYYHGPLTYAAFWLEWEGIGFWKELDYIGVDAYFPMGLPGSNPSVEMLRSGWRHRYIPKLRALSQRHNKPVLFTEFGISSIKQAHVWPWVYRKYNKVDLNVQTNYYKAFFQAFADEGGWFHGFWQWGWTLDTNDGGPQDHTHTIEGKPALEILKREFLNQRKKASQLLLLLKS